LGDIELLDSELLPASVTLKLGPSFHDDLRRIEFSFLAMKTAFKFSLDTAGVTPEDQSICRSDVP
jgi:hypothetical protein